MALFSLIPMPAGPVAVALRSPHRIASKLAESGIKGRFFVPEERLGHGAVPDMTLDENMLLSRPESEGMTSNGVIDWKTVTSFSEQVISDFDVQTPSSRMLAKSLSGGNLQKFMVGRELIRKPKLIIVAQPTWGVDAGSANNIHQALIALADQGSAILIISQDLDEILSLCEQIHVLSEGRLSDAVNMKSDGLEKISQLMVGGEKQ